MVSDLIAADETQLEDGDTKLKLSVGVSLPVHSLLRLPFFRDATLVNWRFLYAV